MGDDVIELDGISSALDGAFREVMETMIGLSVGEPGSESPAGGDQLGSIIGLAGPEFRGMLHVTCSLNAATTFASVLLGGEEALEGDASLVGDSMGEIANMIAGSVKRRLDGTGARIHLSLPSVLQGEAEVLGLHGTGDVHYSWSVEGHPVRTSLVYTRDATAFEDICKK